MTKLQTKKALRSRRAVLLTVADDMLALVMRVSHGCPLTVEKIKEAQFLIDDALTLSEKDR